MICSSVIEFLLILGSYPLGWGGRMGVGVGVGMGVSHTCMHACTYRCMHAHTHTCMSNMINMDASTLAAICNFYTCIHVCACMCMHAHACSHVWGHPPCPQTPTHPPAPSPELQGAQSTKIQ